MYRSNNTCISSNEWPRRSYKHAVELNEITISGDDIPGAL